MLFHYVNSYNYYFFYFCKFLTNKCILKSFCSKAWTTLDVQIYLFSCRQIWKALKSLKSEDLDKMAKML